MTAMLQQAPALNVRQYTPPEVEVGDTVLWWAYAEMESHDPGPCMVLKIGTRTLQVSVFTPLSKALTYKDGVRHINDPDAKREEFIESGAWSTKKEWRDYKKRIADAKIPKEQPPASNQPQTSDKK